MGEQFKSFKYIKRIISPIVLVCFFVTGLQTVQAQEFYLPKPGTMVSLSPWFHPPILKGIKVHTDNPFKFDFILDKGDADLSDQELKDESGKLIKYFLASLTIPEKDLWVNLSPYEKDRIISPNFGGTEMGEQLLAQDYLLKQVTASVLYPEGAIGREFWSRVYAAAYAKYGTHNIPVKTFNKVWIMPDKAVVYENSANNSVMIVQSNLKVMLEEDYLALTKGTKGVKAQTSSALGSQIVREIIIPQITKEVNEGKNFAALRQVYNSLILASWYKYKLKRSLLNKGYADHNKSGGVDVQDKNTSEEIYRQYLKSFRKGVYNYIKEEEDPITHETIPRKYFSGGVTWEKIGNIVRQQIISGPNAAQLAFRKFRPLTMFLVTASLAAGLTITAPKAHAETMAPMGQPVVTSTAVHGDTASGLVARSSAVQMIKQITHKNFKYSDFLKLVQRGAITLEVNGHDVQNPNWDLIHVGDSIKIDLTAFVGPAAAAHAVAPRAEQASAPVVHVAAPVVHFHAPVVHHVSPVAHLAAPVMGSVIATPTPDKVTSTIPLPSTTTTVAGAGPPGPPGPPDEEESTVVPIPPVSIIDQTSTVHTPVGSLSQQLAALQQQLDTLNRANLSDENAISQNLEERQRLQDEIQKIQQQQEAQGTAQERAAEEQALVNEYHLTVEPQPTFSVAPMADTNAAPPFVTFSPDPVGMAWIDYRIHQDELLASQPIHSKSPVSGLFLSSYNASDLSLPVVAGGGNSFSIVPDLPGRNLVNLFRIGQGMSHFSAQSAMNQVAGPIFGAQIVLELRNYAVMHETRGQDVRYDARSGGLLEMLTLHVIPTVSYDQNNNRVTHDLYSVGLVDTFEALLGKVDSVLGNTGFLGDSSKHFVTENLGFQLQINDYHRAFTYAAANNTDSNVIAINVYQVQDQNTRYRQNSHHGWDIVGADTPLDPALDYYAASVKGFVLRYDPDTHQMKAQQDFTSPTFITGAFARHLARSQGDNSDDYLTTPLMERESSLADLRMERTLLKGMDDQGRVILGALRNSVTGRIVRFITDPRELNTMSSVNDNTGRSIQFVPGSGVARPLHSVVRDYIVDQFADTAAEYEGLFHTQTVGEKYGHYDLSGRPQLAAMPPELASLLTSDNLFYDPAPGIRAITAHGEEGFGVVYFADGRMPAPLMSMDNVRTIQSLGETNGIIKNADGTYSFKGLEKELSGNALVLLDANHQAIGVVDPSVKLRQQRLADLQAENESITLHDQGLNNFGTAIDQNGRIRPLLTQEDDFKPARLAGTGVVGQVFGVTHPVTITGDMMVRVQDGRVVEILEAGTAAVKARIVVVRTLQQGGNEVEDQRTGRALVFAKGNVLTDEQRAAGILPESELLNLVWRGQAVSVPVKGSNNMRFVILKEAPQSRLGARPALPASIQTLAELDQHYYLVRWKGANGYSRTDWVAVGSLNKYADMIYRNAIEILKIGPHGTSYSRFVKIYGQQGYELWDSSNMAAKLKTHALVIFKDHQAEFITLDQLNNPQVLNSIRADVDEIQLRDVKQHVVGRVYLDISTEGSRIEIINGNTSKIYELSHFNPLNPVNPVSETLSWIDSNGLKHVKTSDMRAVNQGVYVEDVYQLQSNAKPIKLYSIRPLQQETIYFTPDGHELYSVSDNTSLESGQSVVINGHRVDHVTGLFQYNKETGIGLHISLRDLNKNGGYEPIRRSTFENGRLVLDETGFMKIRPGMTYDQIMESFKSQGHINERDQYTYDANGKGTDRIVSFQANGVWSPAWTIKASIDVPASQIAWLPRLEQNDVIATAFAKYGLNKDTVLTETRRETTEGVTSIDYRIAGDVLERKFITVVEEKGRVSKVIVGLDFNGRTGEQTLSYVMTPDLQVKSLMKTVPNYLSISQILPSQTAETYTELVQKHYNISGANLWDDFAPLGISPSYIPDKVEEIPFTIITDHPQSDGYRATEQSVRALVKEYMNANDQARPAILDKIRDIVRVQDKGKAHYSSVQGNSTFHYLFPNSSRGLDFVTQYSNGDVEMDFWQFEGRTMTLTNGKTKSIHLPPNIIPGSMVLNSSGELQRSLLYNHTEQSTFMSPTGQNYSVNVNYYHILDTPLSETVAYTGTGELVSQSDKYVRNRVLNGGLGVETRGVTTVYYDIFSPYQLPLYGILDEDGRITDVTLNQTFSQDGGKQQQVINSSLEANPTAPAKYAVQTVTNIDGKTVEGSKHEEDVLPGYLQDIKNYLYLYFTVPGALAGLFLTGSLLQKMRLSRIKKKLNNNTNTPGTSEPNIEREVVYPSWNNYGLSEDVVRVARKYFEGNIVPALKERSLENVLNENFESYQNWRKNIMKIDEKFTPTIEDLWLAILIYEDGDIYRSDMPDGLNYLFHKTIEARTKGQGDGIAGFIHKEFQRWHRIIELQQTTFQGLSGGNAKNVVPYDLYFRTEDLNDMFLTRAQMEWYDSLGYTLDGKKDLRSAIYDNFTAKLETKSTALKAAISSLAAKNENNVFRTKRDLPKLPEFQDYLQYFRQIQQGENQLGDTFEFEGASKNDAEKLINHSPLMRKTFSESGAWVGALPTPIRAIKPIAQLLRNNYNPLMYSGGITMATCLAVASFDGMITSTTAAIAAGLLFIAIKLLYYPLSFLLDRNVNNKSFGKTASPWTGYKKLQPTKEQKIYRAGFWSIAIGAKVAWDAFLLHYFLIPHSQTIGATYFPQFMGLELPINFNWILMAAQWSISALFLFLASWSSYYFVGSFFSFIHGAIRGLGTVKTGKDIRSLQQDKVLDRLIDQKLLPASGKGMTADAREKARKAIWNFVFEQMRSRDEISDAEMEAAKKGTLDKFELEQIQKRMATAINALLMDMPQMPEFDNIQTSTMMMPVFSEDIIYSYDDMVKMPTSLEAELNVGYTNLNFIISRAPERWRNLIERVKREGIADDDEINRMTYLLTENGKLGPVNDPLKMQIRLWATYEGQGFARTLDGTMNYVRWLHVLAKISHPDWDEQKIRAEVNKKFQVLWAYQIWGDILKAGDDEPNNQLKREDTIYLLKKYYEELGFFIDIASLQNQGTWHKVLSQYDPSKGSIKDLESIELSEGRPITLEGKPSNQMHASTFVRNAVQFTIDMNQDLSPEQAIKVPILLEEFKDPTVSVVNFPEDIFTGGFSWAALFHAIADRTFVTTSKRQLSMLVSPFHHGHPDAWRSSTIRQHGGVSSTTSVSEDYFGGLRLALKGKKIKNVEYIEFGKARELSWTGMEGITRKFAMGSGQGMLSRYSHWANQRLGTFEGLANFYGGMPFYFKEAIAAFGLFAYALNVMVLGVSSFAAFSAGIVVAMAGVLVIGQAITMNGLTQMALESGVKKAVKFFVGSSMFLVPFFISHVFTAEIGFVSGLLGLAAYVVTGRGFNRGHVPIEDYLKSYSQSHVAKGVLGAVLAIVAVAVWRNWTFVSSALVVLSFVFVALVPFIMNSGNLPIHGVSGKTSRKFLKANGGAGLRLIKETFKNGLAEKNYSKAFVDSVNYSVAYGVWGASTVIGHAVVGAAKTVSKVVPRKKVKSHAIDRAMAVQGPGGIDMGKIALSVESDGKGVTMAFDDQMLLELLRNADGLTPIIYNMRTMSPSMLSQWVGI